MRLASLVTAAGILAVPLTYGADLTGLWKLVSLKNLRTGQAEVVGRQYHMFSKSHHMIVLAGENRPKIEKSFADMSAEEVMSQLPVGAGFYRYRQDGDALVRTNVMALSAYYEGKTFRTEFELEGNRLVLRDSHAADGHRREWKLQRVE